MGSEEPQEGGALCPVTSPLMKRRHFPLSAV